MGNNLFEHIDAGIHEFCDSPVKYSSSALIDFAKDYWDLGLVVLGGMAINKVGGEWSDMERVIAVTGGLIGGVIGGAFDDARGDRNSYAGVSSFAAGLTSGYDVPLVADVLFYGIAGAFGITVWNENRLIGVGNPLAAD